MKTHAYPSTEQATPVPMDLLVYLGVPASAVEVMKLAFAAEVTESVNIVTNPDPLTYPAQPSKGGRHG